MHAMTRNRGRRAWISASISVLLAARIVFFNSHPVASLGVRHNAIRLGASQGAHLPTYPTLRSSARWPCIAKAIAFQGGDAHGGPGASLHRLPPRSPRASSSFASPAESPALAADRDAQLLNAAAGNPSGDFQPQDLVGRYCCSVATTQRLPTRTVVIGGGAAGAEAFDLLHGKPLAAQQQLLRQHQLIRPQQDVKQESKGFLRSGGGGVFIGSSHRVAVQTMANSDTRDVEATVQQVGCGGSSPVVSFVVLLPPLSPLLPDCLWLCASMNFPALLCPPCLLMMSTTNVLCVSSACDSGAALRSSRGRHGAIDCTGAP